MIEQNLIIKSKASIFNVEFDAMQYSAINSAMTEYAVRKVDKYRANENKAVVLEAISLFPALWKGHFKLWLRKRAFLRAKKMAQLQADTDGYKVYVIRSSDIAYKLMSTLDVRHNKRLRVFGKFVDAIVLEETASFTATTKRKIPVLKRR